MPEIHHYWAEFRPLLLVFILALISPGPDFALTLRQALVYGRRAAFFSSLGIGSAIIIHVSYTILGLGLIITKSLFLFNLIKWTGIAYLLYLGFNALNSQESQVSNTPIKSPLSMQPIGRSYLAGFIINLLNPKAVVFFLSIFSNFVATTTSLEIKFIYGLIMASITALWFTMVSSLITALLIKQWFAHFSKWINRISGFVFITFGIGLIFQNPA